MRKIGLCLLAAAMFYTLLLPVLAYPGSNEAGAYSSNKDAYAYLKGWWAMVDHYYKEYHLGEVEDVGENPYTKFEGYYDGDNIYWQIFPLGPHSGYYQTYSVDADIIKTFTDSKTAGGSTVQVCLIPGIQP